MKHTHNLKKVYTSIDLETDYYYLCTKCNSCFSKEQINGYLIKDWRTQLAMFANSNVKVNKQTLKNLTNWRKQNGKKEIV